MSRAARAKGTKRARQEVSDDDAVPVHLYRNLTYKPKGDATLPAPLQAAYEWVVKHFSIPDEFETSKAKYGALSGTCFEERLVSAYEMGLLDCTGRAPAEPFCSCCGTAGHKRMFCPTELATSGGSWAGQSPTALALPASPGDPAGVAKGATSAQGAYAGEESRGTPVRSSGKAKPPARKSARKLAPVAEGAAEESGATSASAPGVQIAE